MRIVNLDSTCVRCQSIWQYDYGMVLRLQGAKLPTATEIHFSFEEHGGEAKPRIGLTKDGITDVVIPDTFVENDFTSNDYKIYVFIYLTDENSCRTEYKITIPVKSRPRLEAFDKPEDTELFREAINEVNKSATSAQESATKSATAKDESIAASKEAKQSAEAASVSAQASKNSADASKESEKTASSAATEAVNAKDIAVKAANSAYNSALASSRSAKEAQTNAEQADTAAKSAAQSKQDIQELKTVINSTAEQIATDRTAVETDKKEVQKAKSDVEDLKSAVEQKSSEALVDLENTEVVIKKNINDLKDVVIEKGNEAISGIETARDNAINDVNTAKDTAVNTITQEKESAVNAVNDAKDNVVAEINKNENVQQIKENKDDIAEAQTNIEELKDKKITKFYANNLGETHLEDSDSGKIQDMFLYGKSEQKQYTGKNLSNGVNNGLWINSGATTCGISDTDLGLYIDVSELSYVTVSTRNVQERYRVGNINTLPTKEVPNVNCYNGTQMDGLNRSYTLDTTGYKYLAVNATNLEDIQIEIGTEATEYEQYVGGIPSPNPEYPQEIKSVVNPNIKIIGKNLLNLMEGKDIVNNNGVTYERNSDGSYKRTGTATGATGNIWLYGGYNKKPKDDMSNVILTLKKNRTYYINDCVLYTLIDGECMSFTGKTTPNKDVPITGVRNDVFVVGKAYDDVVFPIVVEGGIEPEFEQYKEQVVNLPYTLNAIPVKNGGNITIDGQQYIADYVDVERGKVVRKIDKIILTGKENWTMGFESWTTYPHVFKADGLKENILEGNVINTKYTWYQKYANKDLNSMNAPYNKCIAISDARFSSVNEFTDELKKQDSNGTPLIAYYITSTPQEENLSLEKIEFLKSLSTYYSVTNVTVDSEQLDGYTVFNYPISLANGWNYVKQQLNDNRDYIYDMDTQSAEAYVNSEYAVALTELEV